MIEIIKGALLNPRVKHVEPTDNFELLLTFNTGKKKKLDAKTLFQYPIYARLKNIVFSNWLKQIICACIGMMKFTSALMHYMHKTFRCKQLVNIKNL